MKAATLTVASEIDAYISSWGYSNAHWYAGITSAPNQRLFVDHNVARGDKGVWIFRPCANATEARELEAAYHRAGCKGAGGGGDDDSVYIYAYLITQTTVE